MTQNSWKIFVKKSIDDAMHCNFKKKRDKKEGKFRPGETYPYDKSLWRSHEHFQKFYIDYSFGQY